MIDIRLVNMDKDYPTFESWWKERDLFVIPKDYFTPFGFVAEDRNKKPLAAMWLFPVLASKFALIRFPISDPSISNEERSNAIELVINNLQTLATSMNYKYMLCTTNNNGLINRLHDRNYVVDAENCVHMVGVL